MTQPPDNHNPYGQPPEYGQHQWGQQPQGQPPQYGQGQPQYGQAPQPQWGQQPEQPQYGQPQYGQPPQPQWGQQSQQPQYGQPPYGQPQYGQPPQGQPQWNQQPGQTGQFDASWTTPTPPRRRRRTALIAAAAAVVVVGGGAATYVALGQDKGSNGAGDPHQAVSAVVSDLNKADALGVLDHLAPAERDALRDPITDQVKELKRLGVLSADADPSKLSGTTISVKDLGFDGQDEKINDHVTVVKVTKGTISLNADLGKIPFTQKFLQSAFGDNVPSGSVSRSIDIAAETKKAGRPLRLATVKVAGKWYPSLFYTIADNAVAANGGSNPTSNDYIGANGSNSAEAAVRAMIGALSAGDARRAIELLPPDELAVVHDYGGLIVRSRHGDTTNPLTIEDAQFTTSKLSGGTLVSLKSIKLKVRATGEEYSATVDGQCLSVAKGSDSQKFCASQLVSLIESNRVTLTADQKTAVQHLAESLGKIGIVAVQSGGKWYVDPIRSYTGLSLTLMKGLSGNDLFALLELSKTAR